MSSLRLMPAARRLLVRRPWIYWLLVAASAVAAAATVVDRVDRIDAAREQWGSTRRVLVAEHDIAPGEPLVVTARDLPAALVPDAALDPVRRRELRSPGSASSPARSSPRSMSGASIMSVRWHSYPTAGSPSHRRVTRVGGIRSATGCSSPETAWCSPTAAIVVGYHDDVTLVAVPADVAPMIPAAAEAGGVALLLAP